MSAPRKTSLRLSVMSSKSSAALLPPLLLRRGRVPHARDLQTLGIEAEAFCSSGKR